MRESCTSGSARGASSDRRLCSTLSISRSAEGPSISVKQVSGPRNHLHCDLPTPVPAGVSGPSAKKLRVVAGVPTRNPQHLLCAARRRSSDHITSLFFSTSA